MRRLLLAAIERARRVTHPCLGPFRERVEAGRLVLHCDGCRRDIETGIVILEGEA